VYPFLSEVVASTATFRAARAFTLTAGKVLTKYSLQAALIAATVQAGATTAAAVNAGTCR
ncbi:MAG: hypothetical protein WBD07_09015, partial [Vicinamibacterales bacterium]